MNNIRPLIIIAALTAGSGVATYADDPSIQPTTNPATSLGHVGKLLMDYYDRNPAELGTWLKTVPEAERTRLITELNEFTASIEDQTRLADDKNPTRSDSEPRSIAIVVMPSAKSVGKLEGKISGPTVVDENGNKLAHVHFTYTFAPGHDLKLNDSATAPRVEFTIALAVAPKPSVPATAPATRPSDPAK